LTNLKFEFIVLRLIFVANKLIQMKKTILIAVFAVTLFSCKNASGDWDTMASCFSDSAKSWRNSDTVGMKMSDRIEMFKKQRETLMSVDPGMPHLEVVTVESIDEKYKGFKWGMLG